MNTAFRVNVPLVVSFDQRDHCILVFCVGEKSKDLVNCSVPVSCSIVDSMTVLMYLSGVVLHCHLHQLHLHHVRSVLFGNSRLC